MKQKRNMIIGAVILVGILIFFDQYTKMLAVANLAGNVPVIIMDGIFELQYVENYGAAFGVLQNQQGFFYIITILMVIFITFAFLKMPFEKRYIPLRICSVGLLAGALGNFIDRVLNGFVVDFLYFKLINFPVFNVADCYVTIFTIYLAILIFTVYTEEDLTFLSLKKKNKDSANGI